MNYLTPTIQPIPDTVFADAAKKLKEAEALFEPYITPLSEKERMKVLKASKKSSSFIHQGAEYCENNPNLLPNFVSAGEVKVAVDTYKGLLSFMQLLNVFTGNMSDTTMVGSGLAFSELLKFYNSVKEGAKYNVPGARPIYNDLKTRFPGRKKKKNPLPQEVSIVAGNNSDNEMKAA